MGALRKAPAGGIVRTSLDNSWKTPQKILERVRLYFCSGKIEFDPASAPDNPTGAERFCAGAPGTLFAADLPAEDLARRNGLEVAWDWPTFLNPPYGRELKDWLAKIRDEARRGTEIVALLPCSRWEQGYLQAALLDATAMCLIRGRVAFVSSIDGAAVGGNPYASMLVAWCASPVRFRGAFDALGTCLAIDRIKGSWTPPKSAT